MLLLKARRQLYKMATKQILCYVLLMRQVSIVILLKRLIKQCRGLSFGNHLTYIFVGHTWILSTEETQMNVDKDNRQTYNDKVSNVIYYFYKVNTYVTQFFGSIKYIKFEIIFMHSL